MNFNELMQRMRDIDTNAPIAEVSEGGCGMPSAMMGMNPMPPVPNEPMKQQDNVTMNVSMNGSGAGGIRDLMAILKNIEDVGHGEPDMALDMEPEGPEDLDDTGMDMDVLVKKMSPPKTPLIDDDFENEPDEVYAPIQAMTPSGDDLHGNASKGTQGDRFDGQAPRGEPILKVRVESLVPKLSSLYEEIKNR